MVVRDAELADAESIERIRVRGWQVAYRGIYPDAFLAQMPIDWSRWQERLRALPAGWSILVTEKTSGSRRPLGFVSTGPSRDEELEPVGELYALYVEPESWSRGAGTALLQAAEERLATAFDEATLWVLAGNERGRRFYECAGWRADGVGRSYEHGGVSAPAMRYRRLLTRSASRP